MLGRLFNKSAPGTPVSGFNVQPQAQPSIQGSSNPLLGAGAQQHIPQTPPPASINTFEDSYTRETLYGTQDASQIKSQKPPPNLLRIVISQDGGSFRLKQVLLDTADNDTFEASALSRNSSHTLSPSGAKSSKLSLKHLGSKSLHGVGDLNDYMFGSSLPTHELHASVKVHILPDFYTVAQYAVLLSRVFSITDNDVQGDQPLISGDSKNHWCPRATINVYDSFVDALLPLKQIITQKDNVHFSGRFAIGVVVPLASLNDIQDVIFFNWHEISRFFVNLQKLTSKKLISHLTASLVSSLNTHEASDCVINKRVQFPQFALKLDVDINNQLHKLKKLLFCNANIPRLMNSNLLIKSCIQENAQRLNPMLLHWVLEVLNWLEFRDGKNVAACGKFPIHQSSVIEKTTTQKYSFLASLFALLLQFRCLMGTKPLGDSNTDIREVTRVVIMTSNPVVAKKLVFLVNALIPQSNLKVVVDECEPAADSALDGGIDPDSLQDSPTDDDKTDRQTQSSSQTFSGDFPTSSTNYGADDADHVNAVPIPANAKSYGASLEQDPRSTFSRSFSSAKGWEIPTKTCATTFSNTPQDCFRTEGAVQGIPIAKATLLNPGKDHDCSTLSESSTYSYLSSSLSLSVLSASNYSLSRIGGGFMDKWKNSFSSYGSFNNGSLGALHSAMAYCASNAMLMSASTESADYFAAQLSFSNHVHRMSMLSLRTPSPSPACEPDCIVRDQSYSSHAGASRSGSATITEILGGIDNSPHLNGHYQLSRTQSMFDLCNKKRAEAFSQGNSAIPEELSIVNDCIKDVSGVDNDLALHRTTVSVYQPLMYNKEPLDIPEHNHRAVKAKCTRIMKLKAINFKAILVNTLRITRGIDGPCTNDETQATSSNDLPFGSVEYHSVYNKGPVVHKSKPLLPNVAFSDEFRPEFGLQSCPANPKLESQIMSAMKNDMLYNQHHTKHAGITTRTVLVSLRAREIEVIEMQLNDKSFDESFSSDKSLSFRRGSASETTPSQHLCNSRRNHAHNRYKARVRKVYTPLKNKGDIEMMQHVQQTFDDIINLFAKQRQQSPVSNPCPNVGEPYNRDLEESFSDCKLADSGGNDSFHRELTNLVTRLL